MSIVLEGGPFQGDSGGWSSGTFNVAIDMPAANELIVIADSNRRGDRYIESVVDQNADPLTLAIRSETGTGCGGSIYYKVSDGDETTLTLSILGTNNTRVGACAAVFSGCATSSPLDGVDDDGTQASNSSATSTSTGSVTPTGDGLAIYCAGMIDATQHNSSAAWDVGIDLLVPVLANEFDMPAMAYETFAGTSAKSATFSSDDSGPLSGFLAVFKAAAGGPSAIAGTASLSFSPAAAIVGAGALSGEAGLDVGAAGAIVGNGGVSGGADLTVSAAGTVTGTGNVTGTAASTFGADGALDATGTLAGAAALSVSLGGALADANGDQLVGSVGLTLGAAGEMVGTGAVEGEAAVAIGAAGSIADGNSGAITGTAEFQLSATGAVSATGSLEGSVTLVFGTSAELVDVNLGADPIAGVVAMAIAAAGEITGAHAIDGSASITIGTSADLIDAGSLAEVTLVGRFFRRGTDTTWLPSSGGYRYLTKVYLDQPDVDLLDDRVRSREYEMTFEAAALPALERGESVVVGGTTYTVREAPRLVDDGVIARTLLTKPDA